MKIVATKPHTIQNMFNKIAHKYDLANTVLSFGTHKIWKKALVKAAHLKPNQKALDCATGTGDIAFLLEASSKAKIEITAIDFSEQMLSIAQKRAKDLGSQVLFKFADIENLPFEENTFDLALMSFGLRNVSLPQKAFEELARVVKPGGKVLILEFGQPSSPIIRSVYGFYSGKILPRLGGIISGEAQAYKYLHDSSSTFPCGDKLCSLALSTGKYNHCTFKELSFGVAFLYEFLVSRP